MVIETCTECGKSFLPAASHLYKVPGKDKQCSNSCWEAAKRRFNYKQPRGRDLIEKV